MLSLARSTGWESFIDEFKRLLREAGLEWDPRDEELRVDALWHPIRDALHSRRQPGIALRDDAGLVHTLACTVVVEPVQ
jgi:hypothetical protein